MQPATTTPHLCTCGRAVYPDALSSSSLELSPDGRMRWHTCGPVPKHLPEYPRRPGERRTTSHRGSWFGGASR